MILDGKKLASKIYEDLKNKISKLEIKPKLAVILVGENEASLSYIRQKKKFAQYVGMDFVLYQFGENIGENELIKKIEELNNDSQINGYIIQLPLPKNLNTQKIINSINPEKDVDGFTMQNIGKLFLGENKGLISCTPKGIMRLFNEYNIELEGKNITIIGKSNIVGKPLSILLINSGATVTICNSKTKNIAEHTLKSDIIISATGIPKLVKKDIIKPGSIIIDVGFNYIEYRIIGDCDFQNLESENYITPVPGGVGPMTVVMLIENTYIAYLNQNA